MKLFALCIWSLFVVTESLFQFDSSSTSIAVGDVETLTLTDTDPSQDITELKFVYFDNNANQYGPSNYTEMPIDRIPNHPVSHTDVISYNISSLRVGQVIINVFNKIDGAWVVSKSTCKVAVMKYKALDYLQKIIGWIYFICWVVSFYPQIIINFRRKSVIGLSFDFLVLNLFGFICYSIFNLTFLTSSKIQLDYFEAHHSSVIPVEINDIVFSLHAVVLVVITLIQCCIYERADQRVSYQAWGVLAACGLLLIIVLILATQNILTYLSFLYYISYVKLFISIFKLIPQAYLNFKRKSTVGWSIENILLDVSGGTLSIIQMIILSVNFDDWMVYLGNPAKFLLGLVCILFDTVFIAQHYCLYRNRRDPALRVNAVEPEENPDQSLVTA